LPLNLFRFLSPALVFSLGPFWAALIMSLVSGVLAVGYFDLLELTGGRKFVEHNFGRLPLPIQGLIQKKAWATLLLSSLLVGVFPFALALRLLKFPKLISQSLLVISAFAGSFLWTGFVWGIVIAFLKMLLES
jgi:hypothetical protein